jgi:hypothetical protein
MNRKGVNMKQVIITLRSPKGAEYQLATTESKINTVKRNAARWGQTIVKVVVK